MRHAQRHAPPLNVGLLALMAGAGLLVMARPALAADQATDQRLAEIKQALQVQESRLNTQEQQLADQQKTLATQQAEIDRLRTERDGLLADIRAGRSDAPAGSDTAVPYASLSPNPSSTPGALSGSDASTSGAPAMTVSQVEPMRPDPLPQQPVGAAPPPKKVEEVAALPEHVGVLTPKGKLVFTPSLDYVRSSSNRLVFRGVEIVPGIQVGVIEANDADRDSAVATVAMRYGLTSRLEVEARIPYVYRHDRVTTLAQRDETINRTTELDGQQIGDVEFSARYQLNEVRPGRAIFVANARIKPPTGLSPYDVGYDQFGVATSLATGSGFWAIEGGITMLYPSDPGVIFGSLSYLHNVPRDINKEIGGAMVGRVEPGDAISASLGFGLALNPRFSVSFGYSHSFIFPTKTQIGTTIQQSNSLQVGSLLMGWSYRVNDRMTLTNNFEFGVTSDAPDMRMVVAAPMSF
ncbi:coiled-coil domain-containing protein [Asticcacaulis sp.]|uniref:coiled-coil domain-containing protein n=1 Tax=Asticcacaulis sp. TaxID=1872648 RepID=UPI003F7C635F